MPKKSSKSPKDDFELFNSEGGKLRKKDILSFYKDAGSDVLKKVPPMDGSKDDVMNFLFKCAYHKIPNITREDLEVVWKESLDKNKLILDSLEQLKKENEGEADPTTTFKARAYINAIRVIKKLTVPLLSGEQAMKLPGIGKGIAAKIDEILRIGKLRSKEERLVSMINRQTAIEQFLKIWGVKQKDANALYNRGKKTLEDISYDDLNDMQKVGLRYIKDLSEHITSDDIHYISKIISKSIKKEYDDAHIDVCGISKEDISDIFQVQKDEPKASKDEHINILISLEKTRGVLGNIVRQLLDDKAMIEIPYSKTDKIMGISKGANGHMRRINIKIIDSDDRGIGLLYCNGPQKFIKELRERASRQNYRLTEKGLYKLSTVDDNDEKIIVQNEQDIFKELGIDYIEPKDR